MPVPMRQIGSNGAYLTTQKLRRREKFPLIVELEPLFQCNLECVGCGKIQHPEHVLRRRMPVDAGDRRDRGVRRADGLDRRRRAADPSGDRRDRPPADRAQEVRLPVHQRDPDGEEARSFKPSPYFAWAVHIDGLRERHDESVCRDGVFDKAVAGDPRRQGAWVPGDDEHHVLHS